MALAALADFVAGIAGNLAGGIAGDAAGGGNADFAAGAPVVMFTDMFAALAVCCRFHCRSCRFCRSPVVA